MSLSPRLIKANGHLSGSGWTPLELVPAKLNEKASVMPGIPTPNGAKAPSLLHRYANGTTSSHAAPHPNGTRQTDGKTALPRANLQPAPWQPSEILAFQPAPVAVAPPPVWVSKPDPIPDMVELRKKMMDEISLEGEAKANRIVQAAQERADEIIRQAKDTAGDVARQAHEEGLSAAQAEAERLLRASQTIVDEIHAWRESMLAQSEAAVLNLVTDIARALFGNGIILDTEVLRETFTRAVSEAKQLGDLLVHIHPADAATLERAWVESQTVSRATRLDLVPDPAIRRGGCLVEGEYGRVDARVETKWSMVEQTLKETLVANHKPDNDEGGPA